MNDPQILIEIAFADPQRGVLKTFRVPRGCSAAGALRLAALDPDFTGIDLAICAIGIFGKVIRPEQTLEDGDRIELYRPLAADPKEARRARVKQARRR